MRDRTQSQMNKTPLFVACIGLTAVAIAGFAERGTTLALAALIGDLLEGEFRPEYWEFFGFSFFATML